MTPSDLNSSKVHTGKDTANGLLLGTLGDNGPNVYFPRHESLLTLGAPGTGKSQAQIITNLLRYKGSAIVLDVQGELWNLTAGHRAKHFGPVYRFAPFDSTGRTHRFNPFDIVRSKPALAANDCEVFSYQVIANNPQLTEPYWNNRARDHLWACAVAMVLTTPPAQRRLDNLGALLALPFPAIKNTNDPAFTNTDTGLLLETFDKLAVTRNIPDLANAATSLRISMQTGAKRLDSVLDTARQYTARFARSATIRDAMAASDWHPRDLRTRQGTTIYLCIPYKDIEAFAPFLRLIIHAHMQVLMNNLAKPTDMPVTLFLDEMPQLGNFEAIKQMQALGRKAGLRLWMVAQNLNQLLKTYGDNDAMTLVESCQAITFMQPDQPARRLLMDVLGEVENTFTGEKRPLATSAELVNRTYGDKAILYTRGEYPAALTKILAHEKMGHLMIAPPVVAKVPPCP